MKILFSSALLLACLMVNAQFKEPKFGKIDMAEMTMTRYEKDTTAAALILFDNGNVFYSYNNGFQLVVECHYRIKIFKKSAFDLANESIALYGRNFISNFDAATFNLVDGKIVKTKLDNDKIYEEEGKGFKNKKFAFPDVKEGSIIELSYKLTSYSFTRFPSWTFQREYPALWSQFSYKIPEYLSYRKSTKGYLTYDVNIDEQGSQNFIISGYTSPLSVITQDGTLAIKDVPAFISEPNIDCERNYLQSIEFELSSIQWPYEMRQDYTRSWESVNKEMKADEDFGLLLNSKGFVKDTVEMLCKDKTTELEKATAIYNYVQNRMTWNERYTLWATKGLKKPFAEQSGSSASINLLLTLMLQTADLKADPVIFSTRGNGVAAIFYPTINKYNSVISKVDIDGKSYLLDATDKYCPFGVLPANDINGQGRVVNEANGDWVDLAATEKYRELKSYNLTISPEGSFTGTLVENYVGYAAIDLRDDLGHEKSNDEYMRKRQEAEKGLAVNSFSFSNKGNIYKPLVDTLNVEISDRAELIGDKIMFKPLLFETIEKNRYTLEQRQYPIDYNFPISETYLFTYNLPEGYEVESMPQSLTMKLPDGSMSVSYSIQNVDKAIKIAYKRTVSKVQYIPSEYSDLKEFYNQIVKKHSEQIILKKSI